MTLLRFSGFLCVTLMISACTRQLPLNKPYPQWGEQHFLSAQGRAERHLLLLRPDSPQDLSACVLLVHGMNEYVGRYHDIARYFAKNAMVAAIDLTSHGLSNPVFRQANQQLLNGVNNPDISRVFEAQTELRTLDSMRHDLDQGLRFLSQQCDQTSGHQSTPIFIISHSLGSLVSASYMLEQADESIKSRIHGIILTGPAFSVTEVPGWRGWLQNPLIRFTFHTHEHFLTPHNEALPLLLFNQLLALITVPIQDGVMELLSMPVLRDVFTPTTPDWVTDYLSDWNEERTMHQTDPFIVRKTLLRYVLTVAKEIIAFRRAMAGFDTPYLLIYSEFDPITPAWGSEDFFAATQHNHPDNKVMRLAGKSHHEPLFSAPPLRQQILDEIHAWMQRRLPCKTNC